MNYSLVNGNLNVNSNLPNVTGLGTITSGTWNGNAITYPYGGTGLTVLGNPGQVIAVNPAGDALQFNNSSQIYETPATPTGAYIVDGDRWYNTITGYMYTRITDDTGSHWVEL